MKWIKIGLPIALLVAGFGGKFAIEASAQETEEKEQVDTRPTVAVEALSPINYHVAINSYGELSPLESTNLAAQVSGEVVSWHPNFIAGGVVNRGDVLFSIEKDTYEAALLLAQANLSSAEASLIQEEALARVAREEAKTLPKARVTDLYLRKPQVMSAKAAVKSAQAQLRIAQRDLANCEIRAPYDALIVSRNIGVGDYVNIGAVAAVLNNIETAEVTFPIAGFDTRFLTKNIIGADAQVTIQGNANIQRQAIIHRDVGVVDNATRMSHLVARIDDPYALRSDKPVIKFGSYVDVSFQGAELRNVYRISQDLVNNRTLWILDSDNKLHAQPVTVLREEGAEFIISADFNTSKMVTTLPEYPQEGMEVRISDEESNNKDDDNAETLVASKSTID